MHIENGSMVDIAPLIVLVTTYSSKCAVDSAKVPGVSEILIALCIVVVAIEGSRAARLIRVGIHRESARKEL